MRPRRGSSSPGVWGLRGPHFGSAATAHAGAAWRRLRAQRARTLLAAAGIALAAAMAGAAVTVAFGLSTGFDRAAARADLPDVLVRFRPEARGEVDGVLRRLPNLDRAAYRLEVGGVGLAANGERARNGALGLVEAPARGRRPGYAVVAGRDLTTRGGEVVVERGLARAWGLVVGQDLDVGRLGPLRVAGIAVSPDNVAYPLAAVPHVYVSKPWVEGLAGQRFAVNQALVWARDPADVDVLLQQARATSFGLADVRFVTKAGVRVLLDQAAGVVIALLVGFSLVALGAAAVMLGASARADVQRRLTVIGVQRALGVGRGSVAAEHGLTAAAVGLVAGTVGVAAGALLAAGPSDGLLVALNEQPPGAALVAPLAATALLVAALVGAATAWPAWQAAGRPPVALLRGGELAGTGAGRSRRPGRARAGGVGAGPGREVGRAGRAGPLTLGARLVAARRARTLASVAVLAVSGAVILLMLGLAQLVAALRDDPGSVGKRYALTARLPADRVAAVRALPGVAAASPRWVARGADSFSLGEPVKLVAFPGDHTEFEDPPLADGRHVGADDEAEVGVGLAQALGVRVGSTLAVQLPGGEARFRVVGTVRALDDSGRIAYVRPRRLLAADPSLAGEVVVRLRGAGDEARVRRGLTDLGATPTAVGGATTRDGAFLGTLATLLRAVAVVDALVCLYALAQGLALIARERRKTLSVLRALGAGPRTVGAVLAGAALAVAVPAAVVAVALEQLVLAPLVGRLAASYADLVPSLPWGAAALVACALPVLGLVAAAWVARTVLREAPVDGLRGE